MEFVLAFQQPPNSYEIHADPLKEQQVSLAWKHYMGAMAAAGVMQAGTQLDPRNASTVRVRDGQRQVQVGPSDPPCLADSRRAVHDDLARCRRNLFCQLAGRESDRRSINGGPRHAGQQIMSLALCKFPTQPRSFR